MKRSHEYDSPVLSRIVSVIAVLAICICSVCTVLTTYKMTQLTAGTAAVAPGNSATPANNGGNGGNAAAPANNGGNAGTDANNGGGDATPPADTANYQEILDKYTEVMDKLKAEVATYTKKEYQDLPKDKLDMGALASILQPVINGFLTTEDKAEEQQRDDAAQIPIIDNTRGCLLTDVSAIKSASMTENGGKTTIVITLNDEKNSQPAEPGATTAPSNVGGMFSPLSKASIDETLAGISVVKVNSFDLNLVDCTATLVFDTESLKVESLEQIMNYDISADVKAAIIGISGTGFLINTMKIYNVTYK